mmetsp:Transcript_22221/g.66781  ORF Transcript_22221/g.66781 Transcript_22221/m.66781 type:complete len:301 (-) Transcript_22221:394-1296(-)
MDSIQLIDLGPPTAAAAAPAAHGRTSVYEDGGHSGPAAYETDGDMYEDGAVGPNPDGLGPMLYTSQPRGVNGMPLGPEPDPVIPADAPPSAAAQRMPEMNEIEPDTHVAERRRSIIVRGTPLPKWFRTVAEASALVYLVLAIISIVERNVFDGLFFGSITSTALAMELALRGASPPALPGNFCGGHGPNNKPATWFVVGILWLVVANLVAWTVPGHMHLKVYGVAFLLWTGFDLFLLIVMQEFRIFGFDALIVFILFIFNVMFQYEEYTQDEETYAPRTPAVLSAAIFQLSAVQQHRGLI